MKIAIASDHRGVQLKTKITESLEKLGYEVQDFGANTSESVDYPDFAFPAASSVGEGKNEKGILICSTGIGMSITANKVKNVRAALCTSERQAKMTRQHNDSNILVLAADELDDEKNLQLVKIWLETDFEGGRHARRVEKIHELTKN
ncbi:ribose 5-phosphate isomerase B [bacterium]|nr:ribose 5-phosphate isomerase B [bacterium]